MDTIGLIAAMTQESDALLRHIKRWHRTALGKFEGKSFELYEHHCLLVTSGMGMRRASEATKELITTGAPRLLISFGIAGAVEAVLEIGDVVAAEAVGELAQALTGTLLPLDPWVAADRELAERALARRGARLFVGTAVTTGGSQISEDQVRDLIHPILEMETAGIARVAADFGIQLLSIRAISDGTRAPIPFDLGEVMDEHANFRADRLVMAMVRHPGMVLQFNRMLRNTQIAADNAALTIIEVLRNRSAGVG